MNKKNKEIHIEIKLKIIILNFKLLTDDWSFVKEKLLIFSYYINEYITYVYFIILSSIP